MISSSGRRARDQRRRERSPFSSQYSNLLASPIAARRSSQDERRSPAAKYDHVISPGPTERIEEEEQDEEEGEEVEDDDEDGDEDDAGELSPLLPIFSAAHLGMSTGSGVSTLRVCQMLKVVQIVCRSITLLTPSVCSLSHGVRLLSLGTNYDRHKSPSSCSSQSSSKSKHLISQELLFMPSWPIACNLTKRLR